MENIGFIIIQLILSLLGFSKTQPSLPPAFHNALCLLKPAKPTPPENMGIDEITKYPIVQGTPDAPITGFDVFSTGIDIATPVNPDVHGWYLYILYMKSLPNNKKELHYRTTSTYLQDTPQHRGVYTVPVNNPTRAIVDRI